MNPIPNRPFWLHRAVPYLAGIGILLISIGLSLAYHYQIQGDLLNEYTLYLPGVILSLGILFGILIGILITALQAQYLDRASMRLMVEESKREMAKLMTTEQEKQNLEKALLQGQKLQAIGTLAGGIAHDFNNILYAIKGYVEMAREDLDKTSLIHRNLGKVLDATDRGRELISRILAFSRRQHLEYKPIHLQTTIENALALLRPTIPASVNIHMNEIPKDFVITGNQTQLHQVIVNLVNNAVDAMDGEGTITFSISQVSQTDELLKKIIRPSSDSQYCRIDITDTGYGMDHQTMQRVFEPFYTTKEVGKGTGLGLSTVYSIIHDHQGLITVTSQLGKGSSFIILLPILTEPAYDDMK